MEVNNETRQFIEYALKANLPKDTVYSQLRLQGYPDESIERLISHFRDAAQEQAGAPESKAGSFKTIMNIIFIIVLIAAGSLVFLIYPVENLGKSGIMKVPWITAIVVGLIGGSLYAMWRRKIEKKIGFLGIFSVISFGVLAFWIFDSLSYIPGLLPDSFTGPFREYLFRPKFFLAGFVGGVGGILLSAAGLITFLTRIVKRAGTKKVAQAALMAMYGFASLYLLGMMLGSGNMDGAIQYMQTHQTYSLILDIFFGGTFASYALKFLTTPDSLAQDMVRSKPFTVSDQQGFTHWVVAILISVMALGLVIAAWYYEANNQKKTELNTNQSVISSALKNANNPIIDVNLNNNSQLVNKNPDENGCDATQGETWCESQQECVYRGNGCISPEEASKHYRKISEQNGLYTYELSDLNFQFSYPVALGEIVGIYMNNQTANLPGTVLKLQSNHYKNYKSYSGQIPIFAAYTKDWQIYEAPSQYQSVWRADVSANNYCTDDAYAADASNGCKQFNNTNIYYQDSAIYVQQGMYGSGTTIDFERTYYIETNATNYQGITSSISLGSINDDGFLEMSSTQIKNFAASQLNLMAENNRAKITDLEEILKTIKLR